MLVYNIEVALVLLSFHLYRQSIYSESRKLATLKMISWIKGLQHLTQASTPVLADRLRNIPEAKLTLASVLVLPRL